MLVVTAVAAVLALALYVLLPRTVSSETTVRQEQTQTSAPAPQSAVETAAALETERKPRERHSVSSRPGTFRTTPEEPKLPPNTDAATQEEPSERERALAAWERLVEKAAGGIQAGWTNSPERVKQAFENLDVRDRMDCIRYALNLLPDERFSMVCGILYDKDQDPDVLGAIFDDALNRSDEIKAAILEHLREDRNHPLFAEAARIVDAAAPEAP